MVSDGATHTQTDSHMFLHIAHMWKCTHAHATTLIRVVIKTGIREPFLGSFRDAGLILTLPLESQQVAVLINGA